MNQIVFYGTDNLDCQNKATLWYFSIGGEPKGLTERYTDLGHTCCLVATFPITTDQMAWKIINE